MTEQEDTDPDFAELIAEITYDYLGATNPRNCVKVARLAKNQTDARMILEAMQGAQEDVGDGY